MRWPWRKPPAPSLEELAAAALRREQRLREEARFDFVIEAEQRATIPCLDCEIGEPHVCQREWWEQRSQHLRGRECLDPECLCHPTECDECGQVVTRETLLGRAKRAGWETPT